MLIVTVTFTVKPTELTRFKTEMRRQAQTSLEQEDGCIRFDICYSRDTPERCFLYEIYDDQAAFDAHLLSEHYLAFSGTIADWVTSKDVAFLLPDA